MVCPDENACVVCPLLDAQSQGAGAATRGSIAGMLLSSTPKGSTAERTHCQLECGLEATHAMSNMFDGE